MKNDIEKCPECETELVIHYEQIGEVGMYEEVAECSGCGYCEA